MMEVNSNFLYERDVNTNALTPIMQSGLKPSDKVIVEGNRLYVLDAATNARIPVVKLLAGSNDTNEGTSSVLFVDSASQRTEADGSLQTPFKSLSDAIIFVNGKKYPYQPTIFCLSRINESNLIISSSVKIVALFQDIVFENFLTTVKISKYYGLRDLFVEFQNCSINGLQCFSDGNLKFVDCNIKYNPFLLGTSHTTFQQVDVGGCLIQVGERSSWGEVFFYDCRNVALQAGTESNVAAYNTTFTGKADASFSLTGHSVFYNCSFQNDYFTDKTNTIVNLYIGASASVYFFGCSQVPKIEGAKEYYNDRDIKYSPVNYMGGSTLEAHLKGIDLALAGLKKGP